MLPNSNAIDAAINICDTLNNQDDKKIRATWGTHGNVVYLTIHDLDKAQKIVFRAKDSDISK